MTKLSVIAASAAVVALVATVWWLDSRPMTAQQIEAEIRRLEQQQRQQASELLGLWAGCQELSVQAGQPQRECFDAIDKVGDTTRADMNRTQATIDELRTLAGKLPREK